MSQAIETHNGLIPNYDIMQKEKVIWVGGNKAIKILMESCNLKHYMNKKQLKEQ